MPIEAVETRYYLRFSVGDHPGVGPSGRVTEIPALAGRGWGA